MAETLSYDNTPDTEVLTSEEQDSLEVGEKLVAEQEQLLAGKYSSAADSYTHLTLPTIYSVKNSEVSVS